MAPARIAQPLRERPAGFCHGEGAGSTDCSAGFSADAVAGCAGSCFCCCSFCSCSSLGFDWAMAPRGGAGLYVAVPRAQGSGGRLPVLPVGRVVGPTPLELLLLAGALALTAPVEV